MVTTMRSPLRRRDDRRLAAIGDGVVGEIGEEAAERHGIAEKLGGSRLAFKGERDWGSGETAVRDFPLEQVGNRDQLFMVIGLARLDGKKGIVEEPAHVVEILHGIGPRRLIGDELGAETEPRRVSAEIVGDAADQRHARFSRSATRSLSRLEAAMSARNSGALPGASWIA